MKFLEKNLEDIIYDNLSKLKDRGLDLLQPKQDFLLIRRQVQLGAYGIADLITVELLNDGFNKTLFVNIIECKLGQIDINAYQQVQRYKTAVRCILKHFNLSRTDIEIRTMLIGSEMVTTGDFPFVLNSDQDCDCYTYSYDFEGIHFKKHGTMPIDSFGASFLKAYKTHKGISELEDIEISQDPF